MNETIIDFHAHAFPDASLRAAISPARTGGGVKAFLDGKSPLCWIRWMPPVSAPRLSAPSPQTRAIHPILKWSQAIASPRIVPCPPSIPKDPDPWASA